jgi:hypothetical protein
MHTFKNIIFVLLLIGNSYPNLKTEDPITANTSDWIHSEDTNNEPVIATNYITINNQQYKIETSMIIEDTIVSLNENNKITNMETKEVLSYTSQNKDQETSKLLYALNGSTTYNDVLCDENTQVYYQIVPSNTGETLKKLYQNTRIGADIMVTTTIGMDGIMTHTIEISNTSTLTLEGISFIATVDIEINGSEAITTYANGNNGVYMLSGHVNVFGEPIEGISKMYVGEKGMVEEQDLDTNAFSALGAELGSQGPELDNASIYYKGLKQDVKPGEVLSYSYQEAIYTGALKNNVIVEYLDKDNKNLTNIKLLTGEYGETYNTHELYFEGYELVKIEGNKQGYFTNVQQIITYRYKETDGVSLTTKKEDRASYIFLGLLTFGGLFLLYQRVKRKYSNTI